MSQIIQMSHQVNAGNGGVEYRVTRNCRCFGVQLGLHYQINAASTGFYGWWAALFRGQYDGYNVMVGGSPLATKDSAVLAYARRYTSQNTANPNGLYDFNQFYPLAGVPIGAGNILTWYLTGSAVVQLTGECFIYLDP